MGTVAGAAAVAALLAVTGATPDIPRQLADGPTLAGSAVVWADYVGGESVVRRWSAGRGIDEVFRSASVSVHALAGGTRQLAFQRVYPGCPPSSGVVCPTVTDLAIGSVNGPFRPFTNAWNCFLLADYVGLDIETRPNASLVVYDVLDCVRGRIITRLWTHGGPPTGDASVVELRDVSMRAACCGALRIAGRYVAWTEGSNARVVVRDTASRSRLSVRVGDGVHVRPVSFDVQDDGTLVVLTRGRLFWTSARAGGRLHTIARGVQDGPVRIARGRVAYAGRSAVVLATLTGNARTVARFRPPARRRGSLDFDGRRLVFASDVVTDAWIDCPPPGSGRPCFRRERGTTTIWLAELPKLRPIGIASFAFSGIPLPGG